MWFLLIVLLTSPPGVDRVTVLNTFATYEDCQPERDRIGFEMAASYPYENDFRIVCEFREKKSPKVLIRHVVEKGPFLDQASDHPAGDSPLPTLRKTSD